MYYIKTFILRIRQILNMFFYPVFIKFLPINKNKVVFSSAFGKYRGNPRFIFEHLYALNTNIEIVWLIKDAKKNSEKYHYDGVKFVEHDSLKAMIELYTAKIWVDNFTKKIGIKKKDETYYIQTWHGTPLKLIENDVKDKLSHIYVYTSKINVKCMDLLISGNSHSTEVFAKAFNYSGEICECGTPRNDMILNNLDDVNRLKNKYGLDSKKVILFAPTFRKNNNRSGVEQLRSLEPEKLIQIFSEKFGSDFIMLVRFHPSLSDSVDLRDLTNKYKGFLLNVSKYDELEELLLITDVLITDYSSILFDFALLKRPIFLYAFDQQKYKKERGFYIELNELPLIKFNNINDLERILNKYSLEEFSKKTGELLDIIGNFEEGNATSLIVDRIVNIIHSDHINV